MERLTKKEELAGHVVNYVIGDDCFDVWSAPKKFMGNAIDRLAAYEDTGLEPEEIITGKELAEIACGMELLKKYQELGPIDRLRELVEADKEGLCVVLPCKIGDTVYIIDQELDGVQTKWVINTRIIDGYGGNLLNTVWLISRAPYYERHFYVSEFDKTVFLTREAAEAALKEREQNE